MAVRTQYRRRRADLTDFEPVSEDLRHEWPVYTQATFRHPADALTSILTSLKATQDPLIPLLEQALTQSGHPYWKTLLQRSMDPSHRLDVFLKWTAPSLVDDEAFRVLIPSLQWYAKHPKDEHIYRYLVPALVRCFRHPLTQPQVHWVYPQGGRGFAVRLTSSEPLESKPDVWLCPQHVEFLLEKWSWVPEAPLCRKLVAFNEGMAVHADILSMYMHHMHVGDSVLVGVDPLTQIPMAVSKSFYIYKNKSTTEFRFHADDDQGRGENY